MERGKKRQRDEESKKLLPDKKRVKLNTQDGKYKFGMSSINHEYVKQQLIIDKNFVNKLFHYELLKNKNDINYENIFDLILNFDVDLDYIDEEGLTALHIAVYMNNEDLLKALLNHSPNANIGIKNKYSKFNGVRPELLARYFEYFNMEKILTDYSKNKYCYLYN
ncbi:ankyrin repeat domain-containing protein [Candidatus Dependentiae bacterium]